MLLGERITTDNSLEISEKNIVGVLENSEKKNHLAVRWITVLSGIVWVLFIMTVLFAFDIPAFLSHRMQSGYTIVTLSSDSVTISDFSIDVVHNYDAIEVKKSGEGYYYNSEYGDYRGKATVLLTDNDTINILQFEFGFINTNNWHIVNINLKLDISGDEATVRGRLLLVYRMIKALL